MNTLHFQLQRGAPAEKSRLSRRITTAPWVALLAVSLAWAALPMGRAELSAGSKDLGAVWFIGDSITQGGSDQDATRTARSCLYQMLAKAGYSFEFTGHYTANSEGLPATGSSAASNLYFYHSGVGGSLIGSSTSDRNGITQSLPSWWNMGRLQVEKPNLILIMIGTNDVDTNLDLPNAPGRLATLLNTIYTRPGVGSPTVLLASIPPNRGSSAKTSAVSAFNGALPGVAKSFQDQGRDIYLVDQFTDLNNNFSTAMLGPNNLHPNGTGDAYIAQNWFQAIQALTDAPTASTALSIRNPLADSYVRDGDFAKANYGSASTLVGKAAGVGYVRQIYLKFDLSNLPANTGLVKLRLYGSRCPDGTITTTTIESVRSAANDQWTEGGLSWNNRPAASGAALSSVTVSGQVGLWYEWDVSDYVRAKVAAGNAVVTLIVSMDATPANDEGYDVFNSRNAAGNKPQLVFNAAVASPTPTPTPTATPVPPAPPTVLMPVADSYVRDGSYATKNYGSADPLIAKASYPGYTRQICLKFDLSNAPTTATQVKLRLFGGRCPDGTITTITSESVYGSMNENWNEGSVTWNKRPTALNAALSSVTVTGQAAQWYEWDVSQYVLSRNAAHSGTATLIISMDQPPAGDEGYDVFNSRSAATNQPQLVFGATVGRCETAAATVRHLC